MEYYCCSYHHSIYCPECRGELCIERLKYRLNPKFGHTEENENKVIKYKSRSKGDKNKNGVDC